jgi:hypothetical protein
LSLEGDRYIDVHAFNEDAFRQACKYGRHKVVELLVSLGGERAIAGKLLAECMRKDTPKRVLIAMWATGGARGNEQHAVLGCLERVALAEVLRLQARPW